MYKVKIKVSDSFCEWQYELTGSDEYSIQNLIDVITKNTNLVCRKHHLTKHAPDWRVRRRTMEMGLNPPVMQNVETKKRP